MSTEPSKESTLTKAQAAALVKRLVQKLNKDDKPRPVSDPVKESEVLSFRDYGDHVVVVTTDGQKLRGDKK